MKKASLLFGMALLGFTLPARADLTHRLTSSVQLQVDAGYTSVSRAANSYSTSGSGVSTTVTPSGDAIVTTAADVGDVNGYSNTVSTAPGSAGALAGTLSTAGAIGLTAGGAGTSATGQFVTEITIR